MKRKQQAAHNADGRGGRFALLPHCLTASDAYRLASFRAKAIVAVVAARFDGFNNGHICLSARELADALGCQNHRANSTALGECIARGLLVCERPHPRGSRLSPEYRLTWVSSGAAGKVQPATNDYLHWQAGDAGTKPTRNIGKNRPVAIATETSLSVVTTATERKQTVAAIATAETANDVNPPFLVEPSVAAIATHIVSHRGGSKTHPPRSRDIANGPISAAPDAVELRKRMLGVLARLPRGFQGRLAQAASVPPGTLSKFLNHDGPLSEQARIRLTCALPKTEAAALQA
jgi:hypothetical protein